MSMWNSGWANPGTIGASGLNRQELAYQQLLARMNDYGQLAGNVQNSMDSAADQYLGGAPSWVEPRLQSAVDASMNGGLTPAEDTAAMNKIHGNFNNAVAKVAGGGARKGYYSPKHVSNVKTAMMPALAKGYGAYAAKRGEAIRRGRETAMGALTPLYGAERDARRRRRDAFGETIGNLHSGQPVYIGGMSRSGRRMNP